MTSAEETLLVAEDEERHPVLATVLMGILRAIEEHSSGPSSAEDVSLASCRNRRTCADCPARSCDKSSSPPMREHGLPESLVMMVNEKQEECRVSEPSCWEQKDAQPPRPPHLRNLHTIEETEEDDDALDAETYDYNPVSKIGRMQEEEEEGSRPVVSSTSSPLVTSDDSDIGALLAAYDVTMHRRINRDENVNSTVRPGVSSLKSKAEELSAKVILHDTHIVKHYQYDKQNSALCESDQKATAPLQSVQHSPMSIKRKLEQPVGELRTVTERLVSVAAGASRDSPNDEIVLPDDLHGRLSHNERGSAVIIRANPGHGNKITLVESEKQESSEDSSASISPDWGCDSTETDSRRTSNQTESEDINRSKSLVKRRKKQRKHSRSVPVDSSDFDVASEMSSEGQNSATKSARVSLHSSSMYRQETDSDIQEQDKIRNTNSSPHVKRSQCFFDHTMPERHASDSLSAENKEISPEDDRKNTPVQGSKDRISDHVTSCDISHSTENSSSMKDHSNIPPEDWHKAIFHSTSTETQSMRGDTCCVGGSGASSDVDRQRSFHVTPSASRNVSVGSDETGRGMVAIEEMPYSGNISSLTSTADSSEPAQVPRVRHVQPFKHDERGKSLLFRQMFNETESVSKPDSGTSVMSAGQDDTPVQGRQSTLTSGESAECTDSDTKGKLHSLQRGTLFCKNDSESSLITTSTVNDDVDRMSCVQRKITGVYDTVSSVGETSCSKKTESSLSSCRAQRSVMLTFDEDVSTTVFSIEDEENASYQGIPSASEYSPSDLSPNENRQHGRQSSLTSGESGECTGSDPRRKLNFVQSGTLSCKTDSQSSSLITTSVVSDEVDKVPNVQRMIPGVYDTASSEGETSCSKKTESSLSSSRSQRSPKLPSDEDASSTVFSNEDEENTSYQGMPSVSTSRSLIKENRYPASDYSLTELSSNENRVDYHQEQALSNSSQLQSNNSTNSTYGSKSSRKGNSSRISLANVINSLLSMTSIAANSSSNASTHMRASADIDGSSHIQQSFLPSSDVESSQCTSSVETNSSMVSDANCCSKSTDLLEDENDTTEEYGSTVTYAADQSCTDTDSKESRLSDGASHETLTLNRVDIAEAHLIEELGTIAYTGDAGTVTSDEIIAAKPTETYKAESPISDQPRFFPSIERPNIGLVTGEVLSHKNGDDIARDKDKEFTGMNQRQNMGTMQSDIEQLPELQPTSSIEQEFFHDESRHFWSSEDASDSVVFVDLEANDGVLTASFAPLMHDAHHSSDEAVLKASQSEAERAPNANRGSEAKTELRGDTCRINQKVDDFVLGVVTRAVSIMYIGIVIKLALESVSFDEMNLSVKLERALFPSLSEESFVQNHGWTYTKFLESVNLVLSIFTLPPCSTSEENSALGDGLSQRMEDAMFPDHDTNCNEEFGTRWLTGIRQTPAHTLSSGTHVSCVDNGKGKVACGFYSSVQIAWISVFSRCFESLKYIWCICGGLIYCNTLLEFLSRTIYAVFPTRASPPTANIGVQSQLTAFRPFEGGIDAIRLVDVAAGRHATDGVNADINQHIVAARIVARAVTEGMWQNAISSMKVQYQEIYTPSELVLDSACNKNAVSEALDVHSAWTSATASLFTRRRSGDQRVANSVCDMKSVPHARTSPEQNGSDKDVRDSDNKACDQNLGDIAAGVVHDAVSKALDIHSAGTSATASTADIDVRDSDNTGSGWTDVNSVSCEDSSSLTLSLCDMPLSSISFMRRNLADLRDIAKSIIENPSVGKDCGVPRCTTSAPNVSHIVNGEGFTDARSPPHDMRYGGSVTNEFHVSSSECTDFPTVNGQQSPPDNDADNTEREMTTPTGSRSECGPEVAGALAEKSVEADHKNTELSRRVSYTHINITRDIDSLSKDYEKEHRRTEDDSLESNGAMEDVLRAKADSEVSSNDRGSNGLHSRRYSATNDLVASNGKLDALSTEHDKALSLRDSTADGSDYDDQECHSDSTSTSGLSLSDIPMSGISYIREQLASIKNVADSIVSDCTSFVEERSTVSRRSSQLLLGATSGGNVTSPSQETLRESASNAGNNSKTDGISQFSPIEHSAEQKFADHCRHEIMHTAIVHRSENETDGGSVLHQDIQPANHENTNRNAKTSSDTLTNFPGANDEMTEPKSENDASPVDANYTSVKSSSETKLMSYALSDSQGNSKSFQGSVPVESPFSRPSPGRRQVITRRKLPTVAHNSTSNDSDISCGSSIPETSSTSLDAIDESTSRQVRIKAEQGRADVTCHLSGETITVNSTFSSRKDCTTAQSPAAVIKESKEVLDKICVDVRISPRRRRKRIFYKQRETSPKQPKIGFRRGGPIFDKQPALDIKSSNLELTSSSETTAKSQKIDVTAQNSGDFTDEAKLTDQLDNWTLASQQNCGEDMKKNEDHLTPNVSPLSISAKSKRSVSKLIKKITPKKSAETLKTDTGHKVSRSSSDFGCKSDSQCATDEARAVLSMLQDITEGFSIASASYSNVSRMKHLIHRAKSLRTFFASTNRSPSERSVTREDHDRSKRMCKRRSDSSIAWCSTGSESAESDRAVARTPKSSSSTSLLSSIARSLSPRKRKKKRAESGRRVINSRSDQGRNSSPDALAEMYGEMNEEWFTDDAFPDLVSSDQSNEDLTSLNELLNDFVEEWSFDRAEQMPLADSVNDQIRAKFRILLDDLIAKKHRLSGLFEKNSTS